MDGPRMQGKQRCADMRRRLAEAMDERGGEKAQMRMRTRAGQDPWRTGWYLNGRSVRPS
jgi:hypothetical protein